MRPFSSRIVPALLALVPLALLQSPAPAVACAACFGQSDSPMAQGMNMGIFTLLLVILSVLVGIAAFFFYIIRRAARLAASQQETLSSAPAEAPAAALPAAPQLSQ